MTETKSQKEEYMKVGRFRVYALEICKCKRHVCTISELREYEILERTK